MAGWELALEVWDAQPNGVVLAAVPEKPRGEEIEPVGKNGEQSAESKGPSAPLEHLDGSPDHPVPGPSAGTGKYTNQAQNNAHNKFVGKEVDIGGDLPGKIYVQENPGLGRASYHFNSAKEGGPYISYSNAPTNWVTDNEKPFPSKKYFKDVTYDRQSRTLKARIDWSETPVGGQAGWKYTMTFSKDFKTIEAGSITGYDSKSNQHGLARFGLDLGKLIYIFDLTATLLLESCLYPLNFNFFVYF